MSRMVVYASVEIREINPDVVVVVFVVRLKKKKKAKWRPLKKGEEGGKEIVLRSAEKKGEEKRLSLKSGEISKAERRERSLLLPFSSSFLRPKMGTGKGDFFARKKEEEVEARD